MSSGRRCCAISPPADPLWSDARGGCHTEVMTSESIERDTKDWTWVLQRACPECGFDPATVHHTEVADHIRGDAAEWAHRLGEPGVRTRPRATVWSTLEYGCHVRDVHRVFNHRVRLMLDEDDPRFPNWDQDETARADDYSSQDPVTVARELFDAADVVADTYTTCRPRRGRGAGCAATAASSPSPHLRSTTCTTSRIMSTTSHDSSAVDDTTRRSALSAPAEDH